MPFREAHEITGVIVRNCIAQKKNLEDMTLADFQKFHSLFTASVVEEVQHLNVMKKRGTLGGTAPSAVQQQILSAQKLVL